MKFQITQVGVHDEKGNEIEVGTVINVKGDEVPGWLVNKAAPMETARAEKVAVTNPAADPTAGQ